MSIDAELLTVPALEALCTGALRGAGADPDTARSLARSAVDAERRGKTALGTAHVLDYIGALREGRMRGDPDPRVSSSRAAVTVIDADEGAAQLAFDMGREKLVAAARGSGLAILSIHDCFSAGELGYYTAAVAEQGLIALAGTNSPALLSVHGAKEAVTGTNPLSFALPHPSGPRMFDQAASATAWVKVREAAERGEEIPAGWALDPGGDPTTDAAAGLAGALLPFGGVKAGNIALMVDMLAALSGAQFSLDAAPFDRGADSPRLGLFLVAIDPTAFDPEYVERAEDHLRRLREQHGVDFGRRRPTVEEVRIPGDVYRALRDAQSGRDQAPGAGR